MGIFIDILVTFLVILCLLLFSINDTCRLVDVFDLHKALVIIVLRRDTKHSLCGD